MNDLPSPAQGALQRLAVLPYLGFKPWGILDIGAHNGDWSRNIRNVFPNTYIMMIEALEEKTETLAEACQELGNADHKIALLADVPDKPMDFFVVSAPTGVGFVQTGSSVYPENSNYPKETRSLTTTTLEQLLKENRHKYHFMKLDVQGAEIDIISGMGERLQDIEFIQMETSALDYNRGAPLFAEVILKMDALGYVLFDILETMYQDVFLAQFDVLFVKKISDYRPDLNALARGSVYKTR